MTVGTPLLCVLQTKNKKLLQGMVQLRSVCTAVSDPLCVSRHVPAASKGRGSVDVSALIAAQGSAEPTSETVETLERLKIQ